MFSGGGFFFYTHYSTKSVVLCTECLYYGAEHHTLCRNRNYIDKTAALKSFRTKKAIAAEMKSSFN
ncbi:MAG: hypothetical protein A2W91_14600 [Bacteroidetes bacterium GWF2_38_335]|nr:MAG: hypothetical protein A2W91_14600 [Bacteroidetes bacterium GWF2_38_335]OFY79312.1 MAG: hypothetical protein A2281_16555 [Bacteroidetes bacterium RIFOXYA12_FULL_38_20]HBS85569.1 hypothetical protein [Bacteroidales bacterium]